MKTLHEHSTKLFLLSFFAFIISLSFAFFLKPPADANEKVTFLIEKGESLSGASSDLKSKNIVRSEIVLKSLLVLLGGNEGLKAGDYFFDKPVNAITVAKRLVKGIYGVESVRVTIPEGSSIFEIAKIAKTKLYKFNSENFINIASSSEGYLFPDTYYFLSNTDENTVLKTMMDRFDEKIKELEPELSKFGRPLSDVIKMASILEEEARQEETRQIISGILWKRLDEGMLLQVDAAFYYVNGKNTFELTTEDLRTDHPYNTYTRKGLPPTPITNPGIDSIKASINPVPSLYYFYLSDNEGEMHYANTHDEHVKNKDKYLR